METIFLAFAGLGGTIVLLQFLASAVGIGADHDASGDHDTDHGSFLGILTIRSVAAASLFFGLCGLTALAADVPPWGALAAAVLGGYVALYAVASIMKMFRKLRHDGTVRLENAVGQTATVYLKVPGGNAAPGKVTLTIQNRTVECEAFAAAEIPTGRAVRIVAVRGPDAVDVEPI